MQVEVKSVSPREPRARALLSAAYDMMQEMFGADDNLSLDIDGLCAPQVSVFAAEQEGELLGCIALRRASGYGELKSFYVDPSARGRGIARRLLEHLEGVARREGIQVLRLETGVGLAAAQQLYKSAHYIETGPFGPYQRAPASLFFKKVL